MTEWPLAGLLKRAGIHLSTPIPVRSISSITDDSRQVRSGALFVAVKGTQADGHRFLTDAVEQGAVAVIVQEDLRVPSQVMKIRVPDTRAALGPLAAAFWKDPSRHLKAIGVTGTNGKTTVTWLVQHFLQSAGVHCGLVGTICYRIGMGEERPSTNTTPGVIQLQEMLARMAARGLRACVMEVSSHALDQGRVDGVVWTCGVFTNLAPEHLDYHGTMEKYLEAKQRLFRGLEPGSRAVINRDDPSWDKIRAVTRVPVWTFGLKEPADWTAEKIRLALDRTSCELKTPEGTFPVAFRLVGMHNVENLLAAVAASAAVGVPVRTSLEALDSFAGVPGRLERIEEGQPFPVFVDYAHTDDALRRVLQQIRAASPRKILAVFGCGGDRDRTKRPRMGRVAAEFADRVIITSDNPRSEDPEAIAKEVAEGLKGHRTPSEIILDRRAAIRRALESADENWVVLIAGKGHETGQVIGGQTLPFDDRSVVREILCKGSNLTR